MIPDSDNNLMTKFIICFKWNSRVFSIITKIDYTVIFFNSIADVGMNLIFNNHLNLLSFDHRLDSRLESRLDSGLDPRLDYRLDPGLDPRLAHRLDNRLDNRLVL